MLSDNDSEVVVDRDHALVPKLGIISLFKTKEVKQEIILNILVI